MFTSRGVSATVRVTRTRSPPFRPAALRTAALTLLRCRPPITPTVLRYADPFPLTSTAGRLPAASCSMTSAGTSMPVLLPAAATLVSNVTVLGVDAITSPHLSAAGSARCTNGTARARGDNSAHTDARQAPRSSRPHHRRDPPPLPPPPPCRSQPPPASPPLPPPPP